MKSSTCLTFLHFARFGVEERDLPTLHRWIEGAGVRWGMNAEQRAGLGLPDELEQNSWHFGLRRMLLGYAVSAPTRVRGSNLMMKLVD